MEHFAELKGPKYRWVDLTHELSPETPHWYGFKPLEGTLLFDYMPGTPEDMAAPMRCIQYSVASQYGTHVDAPRHFHEHGPHDGADRREGAHFPAVRHR